MSRLLVFLILLNLYILVIVLLYRRGKLGKDFDLVLGFLLMWRTQRGKQAIERIARPKGFWGRAGDFGILLTVVAGGLTLLVVLLQVVVFALAPRQAAQATPEAEFLLGIPGFNPLIPIGYGILGLVVALVIHEGSHGVLARAGDIKVKSLGLLMAVVPIGAFVEPDEEELERAGTRRKLRVFAAGPASNLVLAFVAAALFSGVVVEATTWEGPEDGVLLRGVYEGGPAARAGLSPGDYVLTINARPVVNGTEFSRLLDEKVANQTVNLGVLSPGAAQPRAVTVVLADKYQFFAERGARDESFRGKGALGVAPLDADFPEIYHGILKEPTGSWPALGTYLYHPFFALTTFDPLAEPYRGWVEVDGPLSALPAWAVFVLANSLYWIFWLNLMLGTFNALPMGPLDGGQMFKATVRSYLYRRYSVDRDRLVLDRPLGSPVLSVRGADPETQAKLDRVAVVLKRATWGLGFTILGMLLLPIILGNVLKALG